MQWFKALLDKLKQPSLIIMDNASYHTCLPSTAPKNIHKMAKDDIRALLEKKGVPTDASDLREVLMHRLKAWRDANIPPAVVSAAREKGHEVLFTPPRMCELQPKIPSPLARFARNWGHIQRPQLVCMWQGR